MTDVIPGGSDRNPALIEALLDDGSLDEGSVDDGVEWLDDERLGDGEPPEGNASLLRLLKIGALVLVAGWLIVAGISLLSPSNQLDTTDREDAEPDPPADVDELEVGGGVVGDAGSAQVLRVEGGAGGSVVAVDGDDAMVDDQSDPEPDLPDAAGAAPADGQVAGQGDGEQPSTEGTGPSTAVGVSPATGMSDYRTNLALIQRSSVRNRNHDDSPYLDTPSAALVPTNHYGPRSEYLGNPQGTPEQAFPVANGGQFRASCEFSHFSYDDPLVFPAKPGASHLHMHFGNTHLNAFSTYDTLINSGSSTCNGQELNRTAYWVPAMFDGDGNVRIPNDIVVYYKGEGLSRGASEVYPEGAAMIASDNLDALPREQGGTGGLKMTFVCTDNFSTNTGNGAQTMPSCNGSTFNTPGRWTMLELNVKFPQCWNGQDPADWDNFQPPRSDWYVSRCEGEFNRNLPNMEYFVNYQVEPGESTADWFLSSDIDPTSFGATKATGGSTVHGDWWGGWHKATNQMWIDNCVNHKGAAPSGCGRGYLTDGGPNGSAPYDGPALKFRPQYTGPIKVPAATLFQELCPAPQRAFAKAEDAAYCVPGSGY